jgi:hypothetical protein
VCPAPLQDTPAYEVLYQENSIQNQKLVEKRAQQEAERSKQCTFTPRLVSAQLVKEGRVMKVSGGLRGGAVLLGILVDDSGVGVTSRQAMCTFVLDW